MTDLRVLFFFFMVEGALVGYVGLGLIGIKLNLRQFITVGVLQGLVVWAVRSFYTINEIPFGTHIFLNLVGLVIILYLVTKKRIGICTLAGLLGFIIIILSESLMLPRLHEYFNTTFEQVWADVWLHIVNGYLGEWLLILLAIVLKVSNRSLIRVDEFSQ